MGHLQGEQRQADRAVVGAGGEPVDLVPSGEQPPLGTGPEAHVVPLGRVALDLLLVGEGLDLAEEQQRSDRRLWIAASAQRGRDDPGAGGEVDRVGEHPAGPLHGRVDLLGAAGEGEVDRISEEPIGRAGPPDEVVGTYIVVRIRCRRGSAR